MSPLRLMLFLTLAAFATASCANGRLGSISQMEQSGGSNSDGSKSDGSKSDNSNDGSKSDNSQSSDGPSTESGSDESDSHSKSSGTVTSEGQGGSSGAGIALLVLVGLTLAGLTIAAAVTALDQRGAAAYLDKHGREVRLALARGDGGFVQDVGHNLGLAPAELPHLGQVLRAARHRLEPHVLAVGAAEDEVAKEAHGRDFAVELARVLLEDPALVTPTQAVLEEMKARHGELLPATP